MTTTEPELTTTRTSERITPWLTAVTTKYERLDYRSSHHTWWVSGTMFNSHSSLDIEEYVVDGDTPTRRTALHVSTASGIRAQKLRDGGTVIEVTVDGGRAQMFLPFSLEQIAAAIRAEQEAE